MDGELLKRISLLPRAQAVSVGDSVFSEEQRNLIAEAYQSLLGKQIPNCSCRNRYTDALIEICATFKIKTNMSNCKYQLKAGVIIWIGTDCYSNHNLTDEIAEKYLETFPEAREKEFQAWPEESEQQKDNSIIDEAKLVLEYSRHDREDVEEQLTDESIKRVIACEDTLEEVIGGGDTASIEAAISGLKTAWEQAEKKPIEPREGEGVEGDPNPQPEPEAKPKSKKGK